MKEEIAKTKWCPFARVFHEDKRDGEGEAHVAFNRFFIGKDSFDDGDLSADHTRCYGSGCMAWRPIENVVPFKVDQNVMDHWRKHGYAVSEPDEKGVCIVSKPDQEKDGYCGLAGQP